MGDDLLDLLAGLLHVEDARTAANLAAQHDVLRDGEVVHEHEVLMDHADAVRDSVIGAVDLDGLSVDADLPLVSLVQAVEYVHERALARTVFSQTA